MAEGEKQRIVVLSRGTDVQLRIGEPGAGFIFELAPDQAREISAALAQAADHVERTMAETGASQ